MTDDATLDKIALKTFSVKEKAEGSGLEILLAGENIADHLSGLDIRMEANKPFADVVLFVNPARTIHPVIETLAHVQVGKAADPGPAAAAFLSAIDPEALEQAALRRHDLDPGPQGLTKAMIAQLIDWSNGRT